MNALLWRRRYPKLTFGALGKFINTIIESRQSMSIPVNTECHVSYVKCSLGRINDSKDQLLPNRDLKPIRKVHNWHWEDLFGKAICIPHMVDKQSSPVWGPLEKVWNSALIPEKKQGALLTAEGNEHGENTECLQCYWLWQWTVCSLPGQYGIWKLPLSRRMAHRAAF